MIYTPWAIYNPHKYMHVYIMCALIVCVCEMHAHACALHLCIALSAWDCSQQALLQLVKRTQQGQSLVMKKEHYCKM